MPDFDYAEAIQKNLENVKNRIRVAAEKSGRKAEDIMLVAVSKTVSAEKLYAITEKKDMIFGENRVQKLLEKYDILKERCVWHFIGRLQTNKVKYIIDKVAMIHSLDRSELADEIQKRAKNRNRIMNCLVQVNISGESTKTGIKPAELLPFLKKVSLYPNLRVMGLMTMAPYTENPESVRWIFRELKNISVDMSRENIDNISMRYLSMGMSQDFEVAIEEGSDIVRIGSDIFGKRDYL
ncbi:MAG: YggS family pyridoxal phosphate-dependent enzyme [Clostridiaceae bacterium]|jgi:pyridoxal phosphate enzyme (YggS family)|nr:YggS family pyridoxal phosphate-dependent enzyme [Clostridiaceae bacterium]